MFMMVFPNYSKGTHAKKRQGDSSSCLRLCLLGVALALASTAPLAAAPRIPTAPCALAAAPRIPMAPCALAVSPSVPADTAHPLVPFPGDHTSWHGFDR